MTIVATTIAMIGLGLILSLLFFAWRWWMMPRYAQRAFEQMGTVDAPTRYELSENLLFSEYEYGTTRLPWSKIPDVVADKHLLLIRRADALFFLLPKQQLGDETLNGIYAILASNGVKGNYPR